MVEKSERKGGLDRSTTHKLTRGPTSQPIGIDEIQEKEKRQRRKKKKKEKKRVKVVVEVKVEVKVVVKVVVEVGVVGKK